MSVHLLCQTAPTARAAGNPPDAAFGQESVKERALAGKLNGIGREAAQEHERIRRTYHHYDADPVERRKRDISNAGVRLNSQARWEAFRNALEGNYLPPGMKVLDIGCGYGEDLRRIATEYAHLEPYLHGVDLLTDRIDRARSLVPGAMLWVGGAEEIPYPPGHFDLVIASTVFSSILDDATAHAVASEMLRLVSSTGLIICYDTRYPNPSNGNTRPIGARELRKLFPGTVRELAPATLMPPLARRLGPFTGMAYGPLHAVRFLRSHYLAVIHPGDRPV